MTNLVNLWKNAKSRLEAGGIESPTIDARIMLIKAVSYTHLDVYKRQAL